MPRKLKETSKKGNKIASFSKLESKMVKYKNLIRVSAKENLEKFIYLKSSGIPNGYLPELSDMEKVFGSQILIRKSVYEKLKFAQKDLQSKNPNLSLYVTYGYRNLKIQTERFLKILRKVDSTFFPNPIDLYEEAHRSVAVPTVAGHPTGGAIDVTIKNIISNNFIDFGSKQYDYSTKDCYVFTPNITEVQRKNRMLLRKTLLKAGFAPFDGEWWHFSYGDREWAFYYKRDFAEYSQLYPEDIKFENRI